MNERKMTAEEFALAKGIYVPRRAAYREKINQLNEQLDQTEKVINETTESYEAEIRTAFSGESSAEFEEAFDLVGVVDYAFRFDVNPHWFRSYLFRTYSLTRSNNEVDVPLIRSPLAHEDYYKNFINYARNSGMQREKRSHSQKAIEMAWQLAGVEERKGFGDPLERWSVAYGYTAEHINKFLHHYYSYGDR